MFKKFKTHHDVKELYDKETLAISEFQKAREEISEFVKWATELGMKIVKAENREYIKDPDDDPYVIDINYKKGIITVVYSAHIIQSADGDYEEDDDVQFPLRLLFSKSGFDKYIADIKKNLATKQKKVADKKAAKAERKERATYERLKKKYGD